MTIPEVSESLELICQNPQIVTPYLHGKSGIGKSAIVEQMAKRRGIGFIDFRLSQIESSDIRGIPFANIERGSSQWLPPETIPFKAFEEFYVPDTKNKFSNGGILLLDEINRARFDVFQAVFQLVNARRVGLHGLLDNWFIVCAGNLGEDDHTEVTEFEDAAFNNRFIHFFIEDQGIYDGWIPWAEGKGAVHSDVVGFIKSKPSNIYTEMKEDDPVFCTPRTWDNYSKILQQNPNTDPAVITSMIGQSYLGATAVGFLDYLRVKQRISPKDVIDNYKKHKNIIGKLTRAEKYSLSTEVVSYIESHTRIDNKIINNIHEFIQDHLDKDHMIAIYKSLVNFNITYIAPNGNESESEFMDPYLDICPDMNDVIAKIFKESKSIEN